MHPYLPLVLIIISNIFYHLSTKNTPNAANPWLSLSVSYAVSFFSVIFAYAASGNNLTKDLPQLSWTSIVLGFSLIGIELGYILLYRCGWKVNTGSLLVNAAVSLLLIFLGMMIYREMLSPRQVIGVIFCLLGTFMISK